jgi:hypothetical protein
MVAVVMPWARRSRTIADQLAVDLVEEQRLQPGLELLQGDGVTASGLRPDLVGDMQRPVGKDVGISFAVLAELGGAYLTVVPLLGSFPSKALIAR